MLTYFVILGCFYFVRWRHNRDPSRFERLERGAEFLFGSKHGSKEAKIIMDNPKLAPVIEELRLRQQRREEAQEKQQDDATQKVASAQ